MPKDPIILLSYINTLLRDKYSSFEELCKSENADSEEIKNKLASINYEYDPQKNKFQ